MNALNRYLYGVLKILVLSIVCLCAVDCEAGITALPQPTITATPGFTPTPPATLSASDAKKITDQDQYEQIEEEVDKILADMTPQEESIFDKRLKEQQQIQHNPFVISLFRPNYILPYYYTGNPYTAIYQGNTPDNQPVKSDEFKSQFSFELPIFSSIFGHPNWSFDTAYTQLMYWQVYADSQYFRETNYEPEIFIENHFHSNWLIRGGLDHQSNGRGGDLERSWNRAFGELQVAGGNWLVGVKGWGLIFQDESSNIHNPNIAHYLGYESVLVSYQLERVVLSVEIQGLDTGLKFGSETYTISYPTLKHISLFAQYFMGYGQSLIEYNHRTNSFGVGIAFNDWI